MSEPVANSIDTLLDDRPMSRLQVRTLVLCALLTLFEGYDFQTMALTVSALSEQWGLPASSFGPALAAAMVGVGLGGIVLGPYGDRIGRKPMVASAAALVGIGSLGTTLAESLDGLFFWRFVTGLGFGACMPNIYALVGEYMPRRNRARCMTLLACALSLGAFGSGMVAPPLIDAFGWRGVFVVGGVTPLLVGAIVWLYVPESVKYLLRDGRKPAEIARLLHAMAIDVPQEAIRTGSERTQQTKPSILSLLRGDAARPFVLLTLLWLVNAFTFYAMSNWLPALLGEVGFGRAAALRAGVTVWSGGLVGGLLLSWLIDRYSNRAAIMAGNFLIACAMLALFAAVPPSIAAWTVMLLIVGAAIGGAQFVFAALGESLLPPSVLATGLGWAGSLARIGAVLGPLAGGWAIAGGWGADTLLPMLIVPAAASMAVAIALLSKRAPDASLEHRIQSRVEKA